MFNQILVPVDSSEVAPGILPHVTYLAKGLHVPVLLVTVLDRDNLEALEKTSDGDKEDGYSPDGALEDGWPEVAGDLITYQGLVRENGESYSGEVLENTVRPEGRRLSQLVAQFNEQDIPARGVACVGGEPAEEILRLAEQENCGLIAIATHDRNLLAQAMQGSVTNDLIRSGRVPVLAISPESTGEPPATPGINLSSVLVPLDGSLLAESALPFAEKLAQSLSLKIVLVNVVQEQYTYLPMAGAGQPVVYPSEVEAQVEAQRANENDTQRYLQQVADRLSAKGVIAQWELLRGPAERTLRELAEQVPDNIIALVSHGRSGLARWVLGSVAEDLIRDTGDPVLVIPPGLAEEEVQQS